MSGSTVLSIVALIMIASEVESITPIQFTNVTLEAGVAFRHINGFTEKRHMIETMGPGVAFLDYDGDGHLDIYCVNGHYLPPKAEDRPTNVLYRNRGDGTFVEVTQQAGVGDTGYGMGVAVGDYNNDGNLDIYVTNYGPNVLYRNNGDGTFTDATTEAGVGNELWGVGCAFLDYDNDGDLDLYVANYLDYSLDQKTQALRPYMRQTAKLEEIPKAMTFYPSPDGFDGVSDVLYRNNGDGTFTDVTREAGVFNPGGKGMGMVCGDHDDDGDVDIFVANDLTPNFLYRNEGDGTFTDIGLMAGVSYSRDGYLESSMGPDFGDYDNDGDLDLLVSNFEGEMCSVYENEGNGFFSEEATRTRIGAVTLPYVGWGLGLLDYNNDGRLDLFIANGHTLDNAELFDPNTTYRQRNLLFRNDGVADASKPGNRGRHPLFTDVSSIAGPGLSIVQSSRGATFGDYDNDGDVDIFVVNVNDTANLLRNDGGHQGHWLRIGAEGVRSNRSGIGARIRVVAGDLVQIREVKSGSGLYSQNDLRVHFGLGTRRTVDRIEVRWPSGHRDVIMDVPADQTITIREGVGWIKGNRE